MFDLFVWIALIGLLGLGVLDGLRRRSQNAPDRAHPRPTVRVRKVDVTRRRD